MASIIRIDKAKGKNGGNTHGWQVRIPTGEPRKYRSKLFSDRIYGSRGKALVAAEEYLKTYLEEHPDEAKLASRRPYTTKLQKRNKSGKVGVYRSRDKNLKRKGEGPLRYYWGAFIPKGPHGTKFYRPFYIDEHGEEEAKALAIDFRRLWEEAVDKGEEAVRDFFDRYYFDEIRTRNNMFDPTENFW